MEKRIKIITGLTRSGKTTYLQDLIKANKGVGGILQLSRGVKRFFIDANTKEEIELTSDGQFKDSFTLGKFVFRLTAFDWANKKLKEALNDSEINTIIIDEYGPLEFRGEGFEPLFNTIIETIKNDDKKNLIIIVRKSLFQRFIRKYRLLTDEIIVKEV